MRPVLLPILVLVAFCLTAAPAPLKAEAMARFGRALDVIDARAASQYAGSARLRPDFDANSDATPRFDGSYAGP